jgi:hypothetical protein
MQKKYIALVFTASLLVLLIVAISNILVSMHQINLFPIAITFPTILLCILVLIQDYHVVRTFVPSISNENIARDVRGVSVFVWFGSFVAATLLFGFGVSAPVFILGYLLVLGKKRLLVSMLYTVVVTTVMYFGLNRTLGMAWPSGLLMT